MINQQDLPLYQIVEYNETFENFRSRQVERCTFVCVPNKHGGSGLSNVLSEPNGVGIYGIWMLLLQICSRQKKPRLGYLTSNGKADGRRLGADELAHMLRVPASDIRRALSILSSPRVEWMRLLEGKPERYSDDTRTIPGRYPDDTQALLERYPDDGRTMPEAMPKEGKKEGSTLSKEPENGRYPDDTQAIPERYTDVSQTLCNDSIQHKEAKELFGKLSEDVFGEGRRENQWPHDEEQWLDEALPLSRDAWALIEWFYRLPADHDIFKVTRRRQSLKALIQNLKSEPQKIRSARKVMGLNGLNAEPESDEQWTQERLDAAKTLFPDRESFPGLYGSMALDERKKIEARVKEMAQ